MKFITSERPFTNKLWGIVVYKVLKSDGYSNFLKKTVVKTLNVCFFVFYFEYHKYISIYIIYIILYIIYIYMCVCMCACVSVYMIHTKKIRRNQQLVVERCPASIFFFKMLF